MLTAEGPPPEPTRHSHRLIKDAFDESQKHIPTLSLNLTLRIMVISLINGLLLWNQGHLLFCFASTMMQMHIECLRHRTIEDLRSSQSDLVKNYLFGRSGERLPEVQQKWAFMRGSLETIEDDDITITFLRHALTVIYGFIREPQVYETIQEHVKAASASSNIHESTSNYWPIPMLQYSIPNMRNGMRLLILPAELWRC